MTAARLYLLEFGGVYQGLNAGREISQDQPRLSGSSYNGQVLYPGQAYPGNPGQAVFAGQPVYPNQNPSEVPPPNQNSSGVASSNQNMSNIGLLNQNSLDSASSNQPVPLPPIQNNPISSADLAVIGQSDVLQNSDVQSK